MLRHTPSHIPMSSVCFVNISCFLPHISTPKHSTIHSLPPSFSHHHVRVRQLRPRFHEFTQVRTNDQRSPQSHPAMKTSESGSISLPTKIGAIVVLAGLVIGTFLPLVRLINNSSTDSESVALSSKLSRVPVFTVTDTSGRPYLSETEDGRLRRGYFFVKPSDAQLFLEQIRSENTDAKVLTISLNEAYKFLGGKSTHAKSVPERFELFPDDHQLEVAQEVTGGAFQQIFGKYKVPIFYIDGLGIKEGNDDKMVYPLFFEKEKLDETVSKLKSSDPNASIDLNDVQVIDLEQTIKEIQAGGNPKFNNIIFVPLSDAMEKLRGSSQ